MRIGVPREVKNNEYRVAVTPAGARELIANGHTVFVESGAGAGSAFADDAYRSVGATVMSAASDVWSAADLVVKVKEPIESEYPLLRSDLTLFTYLHLAANRSCTEALLSAGTTALAYETVELPNGALPLLAPMSEVAGRLAPQVGSYMLMRNAGGRGVLPGGVPGTAPASVVVLGCGVAGRHAAEIAAGMRATVTVLDKDIAPLRILDAQLDGRVTTLMSTRQSVDDAVLGADLVIGSVLIAGARAARLVSSELAGAMKPGSVLVDVSIDQGGCFEDSRPTTHDEPTFMVGERLFYCVANMPGAVPVTSTWALTNATLPYVELLAGRGWVEATKTNAALSRGLTTSRGVLRSRPVGEALGIPTD